MVLAKPRLDNFRDYSGQNVNGLNRIRFQELEFGYDVNGPNPWHQDFRPYLIQSNFFTSLTSYRSFALTPRITC